MAKNKQNKGGTKAAAGKKQAQALAREEARREENARKSRQMGFVFLYAFLAVIAVFCLYTLIRTLFFPAASVTGLRSDYLFVSLFSIPYLILAAAILFRRLRSKARAEAPAGVRMAENLLFPIAVIAAFLLFGGQLTRGSMDVTRHRACTTFASALEESGLSVTETEKATGFHTLLETASIGGKVLCGSSTVILNYHEGGSLVRGGFLRQVRSDYADFREARMEVNGVTIHTWPENPDDPGTICAVCAVTDRAVLILELVGPAEQTEVLLPLLQTAAAEAFGS